MQPFGQPRTQRPKFALELRWPQRARCLRLLQALGPEPARGRSRPRGTGRKVNADPDPGDGGPAQPVPQPGWGQRPAPRPLPHLLLAVANLSTWEQCRVPPTRPTGGAHGAAGVQTPGQAEAAHPGPGQPPPGAPFILRPRLGLGVSVFCQPGPPKPHLPGPPQPLPFPCYLQDRRDTQRHKRNGKGKKKPVRRVLVPSFRLQAGGTGAPMALLTPIQTR